jgi:hypothetical protein
MSNKKNDFGTLSFLIEFPLVYCLTDGIYVTIPAYYSNGTHYDQVCELHKIDDYDSVYKEILAFIKTIKLTFNTTKYPVFIFHNPQRNLFGIYYDGSDRTN